ncbi:phage baseplate upper protein [Enterococcus avium]|uniref:phage baseplate upper protein n=1 Tax=Enterococcus avium TaxID=33945 RepID=UPI003843E542
MAKWNAALSTTEPYNYIGILKVRKGNKNTEIFEPTLTENGQVIDLTGCKVFFEAVVGGKYPVERTATIIDAINGKIRYTFDEYSMQELHEQTANFKIVKEEDVIGTTQDFTYFVINAVSKTEGEMGSYWQSVEDLISDMTEYINSNKGDFDKWMKERKEEFEAWRNKQQGDYNAWFESIKDILAQIDPGGTMLLELMDARVDIQGKRHDSISERLLADMQYLYQKLMERLFTIDYGELEVVDILQDDLFSENHEVEKISTVNESLGEGALVIATVDDPVQNVFTIEKVGVI